MKTSTVLLIGGGALLVYLLYKSSSSGAGFSLNAATSSSPLGLQSANCNPFDVQCLLGLGGY